MWVDRMLRSRIRHDDKYQVRQTDQIQQKFMVFLYSELNIDLILSIEYDWLNDSSNQIVLQLVDPLSLSNNDENSDFGVTIVR